MYFGVPLGRAADSDDDDQLDSDNDDQRGKHHCNALFSSAVSYSI